MDSIILVSRGHNVIKRLIRLQRSHVPAQESASGDEGRLVPRPGGELLDTPYRQGLIKAMWDMTSLTKPVFVEYLCRPLERYAELVQLLPASESHHHAYKGGMLDHGLEIACYALKLRQKQLLPPGAKPEDQSSKGELWSAATIYAALMHDAAKVLVDVEVLLEEGQPWRLWNGNIPKPYRVRYRQDRDYHLHSAMNPMLCQRILGTNILDWMMTQPKLFSMFMFTIAGHIERGGIIGELVVQADRASVAKALGGNPVQALAAPIESLQRKLAEGLRYLVKEQFKLNQRGGQAWLTEDSLWLMSPLAVNELKTHLYQQGVKSVPGNLNRLYGEMQAHGLIEEVAEGKAVWQCEISDGEWKHTFNMVKVPPALIWGSDERPEPFSGEVTVQGAGVAEKEDATPAAAEASPNGDGADVLSTSISHTSSRPDGDETSADPVPKVSDREAARAPAESSLEEDLYAMFPALDDSSDAMSIDTKPMSAESSSMEGVASTDQTAIASSDNPHIHSPVDNMATDTADLGERFWLWLKRGINDHSIVINDAKAPVHVVEGTFFLVSPGIFKKFSAESLGDAKQWKAVQNRFQKLGMHIRTSSGQNIHRVSVDGFNKSTELKGYLLSEPTLINKKVPMNNWILSLISSKEMTDE